MPGSPVEQLPVIESGRESVQGLSSTRVKLETLETEKAQKAAAATEALLPNLVRMLDYVIVQTLVATLRDDLARLRALLEQCGVLKVAVEIRTGGVSMDPAEAVIALAIGKQACANDPSPLTALLDLTVADAER